MSPQNQLARRAPVKPSPIMLEQPRSRGTDIFGWVVPTYLLLISGGFAFLRSPLATMRGNELSIDRAAFAVINAVTLTGFQQAIGLDELRVPGEIGVFVLMACGAFLTLIIGGELVARIVGLRYSNRSIYLTAACSLVVAAVLGAVTLGDTFSHGAFVGVSALSNCGLVLGKAPAPTALGTMAILLPLAVAGGLGVPVWLELLDSLIKRRPLSRYSLVSMSVYGGAYIVGFILLLTQMQEYPDFSSALGSCSAAAIASRSSGLPVISLAQFTRAGQWILAAMMIMGPASGSAGGGLKGTTFFVLIRGLIGNYRGHGNSRPAARALSIAAAWIGGFFLLVLCGYLVLLTTAPQLPGENALFLIISAASNVGWSHDPISLVRWSLATLTVVMVLGRALPMLVLWWMLKAAAGNDLPVG